MYDLRRTPWCSALSLCSVCMYHQCDHCVNDRKARDFFIQMLGFVSRNSTYDPHASYVTLSSLATYFCRQHVHYIHDMSPKKVLAFVDALSKDYVNPTEPTTHISPRIIQQKTINSEDSCIFSIEAVHGLALQHICTNLWQVHSTKISGGQKFGFSGANLSKHWSFDCRCSDPRLFEKFKVWKFSVAWALQSWFAVHSIMSRRFVQGIQSTFFTGHKA